MDKLSSDQLRDYIKKQHIKIKRLEGEITSLKSQPLSSNQTDHTLYWDLITRQSTWQQQLASAGISYLLSGLSKLRTQAGHSAILRQALYLWRINVSLIRENGLNTELEESKKTIGHLEQRTVKLKSLLARMRQSHQRSAEDSVSARREAAEELRQRACKEEAERQQLEEQLRCLSFESAFHADMEQAIEKAAQLIASQKQGGNTEVVHLSQKVHELQSQVVDLQQRLTETETERSNLESALQDAMSKSEFLQRTVCTLQEGQEEKEKQLAMMRRQLHDSQAERGDLEAELNIVLSRRSDISAEIEAGAAVKAEKILKEAEATMTELKGLLETSERRAVLAEQRLERAKRELTGLRKAAQDMQKIQRENDGLSRLVRELKRSATGADSDDDEAREREEERHVIKRLGQRNLIVVDRSLIEYIVTQAEKSEHSRSKLAAKAQRLPYVVDYQSRMLTETQRYLNYFWELTCRCEDAVQYIVGRVVSDAISHLDDAVGLESMLESPEDGVADNSTVTNAAREELMSLFLENTASFDTLCLSRLQDADAAHNTSCDSPGERGKLLPPQSPRGCNDTIALIGQSARDRNLLHVYHRVLKKKIKLERMLEELKERLEREKRAIDSAIEENTGNRSPSHVNLDSSAEKNKQSRENVSYIPHDLHWEASDMSIPPGGEVTLPVPMPLLPENSPPNIRVSEFVDIAWTIRGSESLSYIKIHLCSPSGSYQPLKLESSLSNIDKRESPQEELRGTYTIPTNKGIGMLRISNTAVWAAVTVSYSIHLSNSTKVASTPSNDNCISAEDNISHRIPKLQEDYECSMNRIHSLEKQIAALNGPHMVLREALSVGAVLRRRLTRQWVEWEQHKRDAASELNRMKDTGVGVCNTRLDCVGLDNVDVEDGDSSSWSQALSLLRKNLLEKDIESISSVIDGESILNQLHISSTQTSLSQRELAPVLQTQRTRPGRIVFSSALLKISPSSDFRCPVSTPVSKGVYVLSWDFTVLDADAESVSNAHESQSPTAPTPTPSKVDIGFSVVGKSKDGSYPLIIPYSRVGPVGETRVGSLRIHVRSAKDCSDNGDISLATSGVVDVTVPYEEIVVLFDNTYSWFKSKAIRYEISLDYEADASEVEILNGGTRELAEEISTTGSTEDLTSPPPHKSVEKPQVLEDEMTLNCHSCSSDRQISPELAHDEHIDSPIFHNTSQTVISKAKEIISTVADIYRYNSDVIPLAYK